LTRPAASSESIKKHKVTLRRTLQSTAEQWHWLVRGRGGYCTARLTRYRIDSDGVGGGGGANTTNKFPSKKKEKNFCFEMKADWSVFLFLLTFSPSHPPCFFF